MTKNLKHYYQAWELVQQGLTLRQIGKKMGISYQRVHALVRWVEWRIKSPMQKSVELQKLIQKYNKGV